MAQARRGRREMNLARSLKNLISLQTTYTMPATSRKRRGSISPATLTQRAVSQKFPTALQHSRRKSKDVSAQGLRDTEENLIGEERDILLSPGLLSRPPLLANKTPFGVQISSQTAPTFFPFHR